MVSFQCEGCGDVLTKKKLDPHRGQCHGASFSCLDCMVHFQGTEYRSHTSCVTEAQKYQGALYKEKPAKNNKKKAVTIAETAVVKPLNPYVEDVPDADDEYSGAPPPAPSPPPFKNTNTTVAKPRSEKIDVFDFLDSSTTPNASKADLSESMTMVEHAPPIFDAPKQLARIDNGRDDDEEDTGYDVAYEENGFSYGAGPIPPAPPYRHDSNMSTSAGSNEFRTPAQNWERERQQWLHDRRARRDRPPPSLEASRTDSSLTTSDKKRKRGQPDPSNANMAPEHSRYDYEVDTPMMDAAITGHAHYHDRAPPILHSGLTGNLSRMMRYSVSPEYSDEYRSDHSNDEYGYARGHGNEPVSPIKRSKRNKEPVGAGENGLGISMKGQSRTAGKLISLLGAGATIDPTTKALVRTKRRTSEGSSAAAPATSTSREMVQVKKTKRPKTRQLSEVMSSSKTRRRMSGNGADDTDSERGSKEPRKMKAIEYKRLNDSDEGVAKRSKTDDSQMVLYKNGQGADDSDFEESLRIEKAATFLSLVNKGPDSERGCSVHKILKRYHRLESPSRSGSPESKDKEVSNTRDGKEVSKTRGRGRGRNRAGEKERKDEEEQRLWRTLRVKRNDNGEMVLFLP
ncbi:uncharacterized protein GIQ15_00938 [Arthroderma uncinatum]|uniref:uncharacterized protein n=1 Tax=Arthroderma uncinatum TaxID=74035 RepID=UPI00144AD38A|nr:uncharacterized protein GIQ15_00938 [Arthroderma uncinatum]KAF3491421.1 hypothetical protein GIQ15_00938 [Arthroderma uncinatum]